MVCRFLYKHVSISTKRKIVVSTFPKPFVFDGAYCPKTKMNEVPGVAGRLEEGFNENKNGTFDQKIKCTVRWSWRESNPRPNTSSERLLHAYLCIIFSRHGRGITNQPCPYPLLFQHSLTETMSTYFT